MTAAGQDYVRQMQPLVTQNRALGEQFLTLASKIKKGEVDAPTVSAELQKSVVPAAKAVAEQVTLVRPQNSVLITPHAELADAWSDRARAYQAATQAWANGDLAGFDKAVKAAGEAAEHEAQAADRINAELHGTGVQVDLYP